MILKETFDRVASFSFLLLFFPIYLILYILVYFFLGKPVFFKQKRPGKNEKIFELVKFRTMNNAKDKNGQLLSDEKRLTRFGKFLRSTSIDELPSVWNILKGDMSFVGPRPLLIDYLPHYSERQKLRHSIKPGITGWAQINGRNNVDWEKKLEYDVWYYENRTFIMDIKIILLSVKKVLFREGISKSGFATTEKFKGGKH